MDHISHKINKDPLEVRLSNMTDEKSNYLKEYINELKSWADIDQRKQKIEIFNKKNRWIKRGLSITPNIYHIYTMSSYPVIISVYHIDGTVSVAHGGIEIGQGINTKVEKK